MVTDPTPAGPIRRGMKGQPRSGLQYCRAPATPYQPLHSRSPLQAPPQRRNANATPGTPPPLKRSPGARPGFGGQEKQKATPGLITGLLTECPHPPSIYAPTAARCPGTRACPGPRTPSHCKGLATQRNRQHFHGFGGTVLARPRPLGPSGGHKGGQVRATAGGGGGGAQEKFVYLQLGLFSTFRFFLKERCSDVGKGGVGHGQGPKRPAPPLDNGLVRS